MVSNVLLRTFLCLWTLCLNSENEIKKVGGLSAKPTHKKVKSITTETLHLVTNINEDDNFTKKVPEQKEC